MVAQTGCDAVMIGRTAPSNPWIFRQIRQYCASIRNEPIEAGAPSGPIEAVGNWQASFERAGAVSRLGHDYYDQPSESDRYQMIRTYFQMLIQEEMSGTEGKMKQFASWFTHGVAGGAPLRKAIYESKSAPEILVKVEEFFEARLCSQPGWQAV